MRLINTETLELKEFLSNEPVYAILSHTWGYEEVTFEDWLYAQEKNPPRWGWVYNQEEVAAIKAKSGYQKISKACTRAAGDGISWLWADTNCINKSSSAELSEAINSMYRWYQRAKICYAFLADVSSETMVHCDEPGSDFRGSRWFTRGWTLQELVAPKDLMFFSQSWTPIGAKSKMSTLLEQITSIPRDVLRNPQILHCDCGEGHFGHVSTAEIMSWASSRTTTKVEDMAYSLMGLFDVNMALLYGEGNKAFFRLQLEIAQKSGDLTILSWQNVPGYRRIHQTTSIHPARKMEAFAEHPMNFSFGQRIERYFKPCKTQISNPRSADNSFDIGTRLLTLRLPLVDTLSSGRKYAVLPYQRFGRALWIPLESVAVSGHGRNVRQFARVNWPQATISVPAISWTSPAVEIDIPFRGVKNGNAISVIMSRPSKPLFAEKIKYDISIHLTFPAGIGEYEVTTQFPTNQSELFTKDSLLKLWVDPEIPGFAVGAVEFASPYRTVAIFFLVEISLSPQAKIVRWTAQDISSSQFDKSDLERLRYSIHNRSTLSSRVQSQLSYLISSSINDDCIISSKLEWNYESALCSKLAPGSKNDGIVVLDTRVHDILNSESAYDGKTSETGSTTATDEGVGPRYIIAQIVFPCENSRDALDFGELEDNPPKHSQNVDYISFEDQNHDWD